jgi:hypothetical protein
MAHMRHDRLPLLQSPYSECTENMRLPINLQTYNLPSWVKGVEAVGS